MNQGESDLDRYFVTFNLDERIILKWIFKKWEVVGWTGLICLRIETSGAML